MCFDFLYSFCLKHFSFSEEMSEILSKMYIVLRVKYPLFLSDFNETWISRQTFVNSPTIKFHEYPSSESRVVPCRRTDMMKLRVAFRNLAKTPKMYIDLHVNQSLLLSDFNETWIFSTDFWKYWNEIPRKSVKREQICSTRKDRWTIRETDMGEANSRSSQFAKSA